jgi:hypothetical protein
MVPAGRGNRFGRFTCRLQFRDFHAIFFRAFYQMLPRKRSGPLGRKLVVKGHRVVVVKKHEIIAYGQIKPPFYNQSMFNGTGNGPNVHDFIGWD